MIVQSAGVAGAFERRFNALPACVVRAPGRVNLIGEHTDYNEGYVLPMAITRYTTIAARPRNDARLHVYAACFDAWAEADLGAPARSASHPWLDYVVGVAHALLCLGYEVSGADVFVDGDIPLGAGLSSSASLEMAACLMFERLGGFSMAGSEAAKLGRRVENEFLGLNSGIMDQFVTRMAERDHALFLDCRTLEYRAVPLHGDHAVFVIANTNAPHRLTSSKYNTRVRECMESVAILNHVCGREGTHLRDFSIEDVEHARQALGDPLYRRSRHVVRENARTIEACIAMESGDMGRLGRLMNASHESLRLDYEVTFDADESEIDLLTTMAGIAQGLPGCFGARMTGGGFGGSTINVVHEAYAEPFCRALMARYKELTGREGHVLVSGAASGAEAMAIDE